MMNAFEIKILDFIRETFSCAPLDFFFKYFTKLGGVAYMVGIAALMLIIRKTRKSGICAAIALILGVVVGNFILKNIFDRVRPYDFNTAVSLIVPPEHDFSFPSGHALAVFEVALSVFFYNKKAGTVAIIAASLIAFSRLYLYVHYPSDVATGVILGICSAFLARLITKKITDKFPQILKW